MADTFTPPVAPSADGSGTEATPSVDETRFGDGYVGRAPQGLNALDGETASLIWSIVSSANAETIEAFLKPKLSWQPFLYTLPWESTLKQWVCKTWRRRPHPIGGDNDVVAVTFERDFSL